MRSNKIEKPQMTRKTIDDWVGLAIKASVLSWMPRACRKLSYQRSKNSDL